MLNETQHDSLTELINISYARAAGALSQLTGYRVDLQVPHSAVYPLEELSARLKSAMNGQVTAVTQVFSGFVSGNAMMVLDEGGASLLCDVLLDDGPRSGDWAGAWSEANREVITELGNILLNACLGTFGNLLKIQVTFSVPMLHIEAMDTVLRSTAIAGDNLTHGLMIQTKFQLRDTDVSGYLLIILGVTSLDRLIAGLDNWEV